MQLSSFFLKLLKFWAIVLTSKILILFSIFLSHCMCESALLVNEWHTSCGVETLVPSNTCLQTTASYVYIGLTGATATGPPKHLLLEQFLIDKYLHWFIFECKTRTRETHVSKQPCYIFATCATSHGNAGIKQGKTFCCVFSLLITSCIGLYLIIRLEP